jgi:hypothetical protein
MATADEYAAWIVANAAKKGTPEFETVAKAYEMAKGEAAKPAAAEPAPSGRRITSFQRGPSPEDMAAAQATAAEPAPTGRRIASFQRGPSEEDLAAARAQQAPAGPPETTAAGLAGAVTRGVAPAAVMAGLGALAAPVVGVPALAGAGIGAAALGASQLLGLDTGFTQQLQGLLSKAGVAEPQTATERLLQAAAGGLSSGVGGVAAGQALMKTAAPVAQAAGAMLAEAPASQVAADIVGSSAAQAASELGLGPGGQIVAAIIGGGAGGKLPASGRAVPSPLTAGEFGKQAKRAVEGPFAERALGRLATEVQADPETIAAAERLGVTQYLQPDHITTSQVVREIGQAVKSRPGSAARAAEMEGLAQVGEVAAKLIDDVGGTRDLSTLNERVRSGIKQQAAALKGKSDALYGEIAQAIPSNTRVRTDKTLAYIQQRAKEMNGVENLTPIEKELLSKLTPQQIPSKSGKSVREIPPTYALVDELRKDVGEIAGGPGLVPDRSTRVAKELRELMTQDQEVAAQAAGVADKWTQAKEAVKLRKGLEDDMALLFGKEFDESLVTKLTTSTTGLSKGDADRFAKIIKAIPDNMRKDVVASALGTAFGKATKNGELNFNTFAKFYDGLTQNKQAAAALFSNLPPSAKARFDDLAKVSKAIAQATRENIPTGRMMDTQQQLKEADGIADMLYSVAAKGAIGIPIEAMSSAAGLRGAGLAAGLATGLSSALSKQRTTAAKAADAVLLSPEFRRLVIDNAGNPTVQQTAIRRLASSPKFDVFAQAAGLPRAMSDRELFIRNALTAGATAEPQEQPTP